jgi:hypothetical protein
MKKPLSFKGIALALASTVALAGSLVGGGVALAANDTVVLDDPPGTPGPFQQLRDQALENFYQRAQLALQSQQLRIDLANQIAEASQTWIDTLKGQGKDTSTLESALADFKAGVAAGQDEHDQAASILDAHQGFDGSGKVTNRDQARQTLQGARDHLVAAHRDLRDATVEFRRVVNDFRRQNRPNKNGQGTSAPQGQSS